VLYETLSGVAATLILPSIRDAVWGIYFRYRAWQGSPSYAPGVRYARLINGKGCGNYGACRLEACGWLRVDLCFPDGRMPLANRKFKQFDGVLAHADRQPPYIRAMPGMPIHDP